MLFLSESSYPFACLSSLFLGKGLKSLEKCFDTMSVGVASCVSPGKIIHFLHGDYLFERLAVDSSACKATVAFVVTEVDSIHSQPTCTKNYNDYYQTHIFSTVANNNNSHNLAKKNECSKVLHNGGTPQLID